ncbi:MAG: 3-isopropylmalate dehydratase [Candidatus Eiseniibacteriota bacterium]
MSKAGRVWRFGDNIDTDVLAPGLYMKKPIVELAEHCLEAVDPKFAKAVRPGDIVVAGRNFGMGSSREQAAQALLALGVTAILAKSFGGIFYRNALNHGLLALTCADADRIEAGDKLAIDGVKGEVVVERTGERLACEPLPPHLLEMIEDGGLVAHLEKKLARKRAGT